jgi:very-short-patch-repair endonuclease
MAKRTIRSFQRKTAQRLRADSTNAEAVLWTHLRRLDITDSHFRRQVVIGSYIADFACMSARLIIEVDGSQHGTESGLAADAVRTRWLESEGYRVLRFWNNDVTGDIDAVLEAIYAALVEAGAVDTSVPSPTSSPSP